jgi:hypothetical protein
MILTESCAYSESTTTSSEPTEALMAHRLQNKVPYRIEKSLASTTTGGKVIAAVCFSCPRPPEYQFAPNRPANS